MTVSTLKELVPGAVVAPGDAGLGRRPPLPLRHRRADRRSSARPPSTTCARRCATRPPSGSTSWCAAAATAHGARCPAGSRSTSPRSTTSTSTARSCASAAARRGARVARTLAEHGLGVSSGDTASVGVGGLTLGGGIGWMVRAWGLAADQLVGAQLVTARGRRARGHRGVASRAVLGAARRRRQLRRRHALRLPRARADRRWCSPTLGVAGDSRPVLRALRDTLPRCAARAHRHLHGRAGDGSERSRRRERSRRAGSATTSPPRARRWRRCSRSTA